MTITAKRKKTCFYPNPKRVIAKFYMPIKEDRAKIIVINILRLSEEEVSRMLDRVLSDFSKRHRNISKIFENSFNSLKNILGNINNNKKPLSLKKKLLIGSYFTTEYSIESTAFFNPSIVEAPDQSNLEEGQKRIIVSFRATGEKHISSIVFRQGIIDKDNSLKFQPEGRLVDVPEIIKRHVYKKKNFLKKLSEMHIQKDVVNIVMDKLGKTFLYGELKRSIEETLEQVKVTPSKMKVIESLMWLARSHYEVKFSLDTAISERVLFPVSYAEVNGIEDARFVKFTDDNGKVTYYATYTAYDGFTILPKLMKTSDFYHFKVMPIHGEYAQNKGMSLFPRKINGKYAMIARSDGINNYIMFSDNINFWGSIEKIQEPLQSWELIKIGNSGSPLETEKGWLLITHGVGPMRSYSLGALLLDKNDPTNVIGRLAEPLLIPNEEEREGYVPNVVYSCGSIIHNNELIIAYGMSDYASGFAGIPLDELFEKLTNH
ncbi:MAG: glycoside hydrolase family 130 protein [Candidatus Aminicenantes bacterium]|nr:glycoside hydrolase family 130 protein [Candidatus Aminicenantes bacterium]